MKRKPMNLKEKLFVSAVKELSCVICRAPPPSEFHHICDTGRRLGHMYGLSLCASCHRGDDGFSGKNRDAWDKSLKNQLKLLAITCAKLSVKPPEFRSKVVKCSL